MKFAPMLKQPSAFVPVAMSLAALATVIVHIAFYGVARQADEGAAAHIFQLLLVAQVPVVGFFAIKWGPRNPKEAMTVLVLQLVAGLVALAPVFYFKW